MSTVERLVAYYSNYPDLAALSRRVKDLCSGKNPEHWEAETGFPLQLPREVFLASKVEQLAAIRAVRAAIERKGKNA
ncbi:MAG: hypothetical protein AAB500_00665 [Patescibacteria group bacterium]